MDYRTRLKRLRNFRAVNPEGRAGRTGERPALLLTHGADVRYLCGFTGSNSVLLLLSPRAAVLFTDGRYTAQAAEQTAGSGVRVVIGKQLLPKAVARALAAGATSLQYDSAHTTVATLRALEAALQKEGSDTAVRRRFLQPLEGSPVAKLRECKDAEELAIMEQAALLGCRLFDTIVPHLAAGVPERDIAAELEYAARREGAERMSFETIVASGKRSALPHGQASEQPLPRRGFITLDFGVMLRGYCSDMTRTVYMGKPTREERIAYNAVLEAEQAGVAAVHVGAPAAAVDRATRNVLRSRGLGQFFTHSTGHGVGLEIHEGPRLGSGVEQTLEEGMVVTVEPGVYLPDRFGIRIEDMVVVQEAGSRILTPTSKDLLTL